VSKAAAATANAAAAAAAPQKPPSSKLKLMVIALVPLLAAGGGGTWWYLHRADAAAAAAGGEAAHPTKSPVFMTLEPFTVNLVEEGGDHYLQIGIVFQVDDSKVADDTKAYMPIVRDRILRLLSAKRPSDIASSDGKHKLIEEIVAAVRGVVPAATGKGIQGALLSSFVIQ
jgi:flagellar FliL protein